MNIKRFISGAALASGLIASGASAGNLIATVTAGYIFDNVTLDGPIMYITNTSATPFDSVRITSLFGPNSPTFEDLGSLAGFDRAFVPFTDVTGTTAFAEDPDEGGLLNNVYQVQITQGGHTYVSSLFSPSMNDSGGCVAFLGLNCDFSVEDGNVIPVQVGSIYGPTTGVPEPAVWTTLLVGLGLAGASLRQTNRRRNGSAVRG